MKDPERWLSSANAPEGMQEMLKEAQDLAPSTAQRAALVAKLGVSTSALWSMTTAGTLTLAGALIAGGGWFYARATIHSSSDTPVIVEPKAAPSPTEKAAVMRSAEEVTNQPKIQPKLVGQKNASVAIKNRPQSPKHKKEKSTPDRISPLVSEASLLSSAQAQLRSNPSAALEILAMHERLYPSGILAEERKVLKLRALQLSGQSRKAKEQEARLRREHPNSVHHLP